MFEGVKETLCNRCAHRSVCTHKNDYLAIVKTISEAHVSSLLPNGTMVSKRIVNYDFIDNISVACRYYANQIMNYRRTDISDAK